MAKLLAERKRRKFEAVLGQYKPYRKQRIFHAAGADHRERLFRAGNQLGKTIAGGHEAAYHITGLYPDWWEGKRFEKATHGWASGVTGESTRDNPQRILLGRPGKIGSGTIPKDSIVKYTRARGVPDAIDSVIVKHASGGLSTVGFKSYEKGREKWQGETLEWVWFDEEPPEDIYTEGLARTNATGGLVWTTFTPLLGMSNVVRKFLKNDSPDCHDTNMTIEDVEHYTKEERERIINSYPAHEREARAKGIPTLGSGRIFPISESDIEYESMEFPRTTFWIAGIDFGWDHPTAAVKLAWDTEADIVYVTAAYRRSEQTSLIHAGALKPWGSWLPWSWPHDGRKHDGDSGKRISTQYKDHGLKMLPYNATFEDGSNGVEAGVLEMLERMQTGRLKVAKHLEDWWDEFRLYHRKDGKIVKEYDDLMSATRYGIMMLRCAVQKPSMAQQVQQKQRKYDPQARLK